MEKEQTITLKKIQEIAENIDKRGDTIAVYKHVPKNCMVQDFVMMFMDNMSDIMEKHRLTTNEMRVMYKLGKYMQFGNQIQIYRKTLAEELNMRLTHLNTAIRKLKAVKILIEDDFNTYFNPQLFVKGKINDYVIELSQNTEIKDAIRIKQT